jgi:hypothetical protein
MKNEIIEILEEFRKSRFIKSYGVDLYENNSNKPYIGILTLKVDGEVIVREEISYNPERQKFSTISDMLLKKFKKTVIAAGLAALITSSEEVRKMAKNGAWTETDTAEY